MTGGRADHSAMAEFLAVADLDQLADLDLGAVTDDPAGPALVREIVSGWTDVQAVANLLMRPRLIPTDLRADAVRRGLGDTQQPYLRLAAAVGIGLGADLPHPPVSALLDLVVADAGTLAVRASVAVAGVLRADDAREVAECLGHPHPSVRHNLMQGLLAVLGRDDLSALLRESDVVLPAAAALLHSDDGTAPGPLEPPPSQPLLLSWIPSYRDATGSAA